MYQLVLTICLFNMSGNYYCKEQVVKRDIRGLNDCNLRKADVHYVFGYGDRGYWIPTCREQR